MRRPIGPTLYILKFSLWGDLRNEVAYTALPRQKEVMTIFMFLRYGIKTKFCLIYPIFNKKFKFFDA